ncbi:putative bifunctional diguanylate cyclase/phosphodiesterase [Asticcacaulis sp. 201]|uniref:putative bifunctional diguanylate cyclase/phosphodiesterase n=1 Tax=Asticcacaulis sp. 201 TaxID=3028787 RepID=UPI002915C8F3|nr:EAL domain-containing protein [Asticcacaulis sp. 201]MDV6330408.1 EAL domain-containing protein [Asticcacaulis sp. 201]
MPDLLVVIAVSLIGTLVLHRFDWFEALYAFTRPYESLQIDNLLIVVVFTAIGATIICVRRSMEMRRQYEQRLKAEGRMETLALTDALTGLANRRHLYGALKQKLGASPTDAHGFAVCIFDLDRFKPINDIHGHLVGDQLLQQIAQRAQAQLRSGDLLARLGGDEFALIVNTSSADEDISGLAQRLISSLSEPFRIDQLVCHVGASMGIAFAQGGTSQTPDALLQKADLALYRAKTEGRGTFRFYQDAMDAKIHERTLIELELREAVEQRQIHPYFQPLVCLRDSRIEGYEVLARWIHPTWGPVSPERFIKIAEEAGLIGEISLSLLEQACEQARDWPKGTYLSLNISPVQFRDPQLSTKICDILYKAGFPAACLEIEITENALVHDVDVARNTLMSLKARGMTLALDDFGTGYSSLQHLRSLPFDKLKIDQSFVMNMSESGESRKLVKAIIAMSHSLGLKTTAEGIETHAHALRLTQMGCETGQGYLFGKPAPQACQTLEVSGAA